MIIEAIHHIRAMGRPEPEDPFAYPCKLNPNITLYSKKRPFVVLAVTSRTLFVLPMYSNGSKGLQGHKLNDCVSFKNADVREDFVSETRHYVSGYCAKGKSKSFINLTRSTWFSREHNHPKMGNLDVGELSRLKELWGNAMGFPFDSVTAPPAATEEPTTTTRSTPRAGPSKRKASKSLLDDDTAEAIAEHQAYIDGHL